MNWFGADERNAPPPPASDSTPASAPGRRRRFIWARIALSVLVLGVCGWAFTRLDLRATWQTLLASNWWLLALAALANLVVHLGLKATRWYVMLRPHGHVSFRHAYLYTLAANAASSALPARAGEVLRATLVRPHGVSLPTSAGIQIMEAATETTSLVLVALPLPWLLELPLGVRRAFGWLAVAAGIATLLAVLVTVHGHRLQSFAAWLGRGASALRSWRAAVVVGLVTLAARYADAGILILAAHAVGVHVNLWVAFLVILAIDVALLVPTTPGGLGAFEAAVVGGLALLGQPPEHALAFALAYHALQVIPGMVTGSLALWFIRARAAPFSPRP